MFVMKLKIPKTTCLPSKKSHFAHVMKNWQPFVSFPLFAFEKLVIFNSYLRVYLNFQKKTYHRKQASIVMLKLKVLVSKSTTIDRHYSTSIVLKYPNKYLKNEKKIKISFFIFFYVYEISSLNHKVLDNS